MKLAQAIVVTWITGTRFIKPNRIHCMLLLHSCSQQNGDLFFALCVGTWKKRRKKRHIHPSVHFLHDFVEWCSGVSVAPDDSFHCAVLAKSGIPLKKTEHDGFYIDQHYERHFLRGSRQRWGTAAANTHPALTVCYVCAFQAYSKYECTERERACNPPPHFWLFALLKDVQGKQ